MDRILHAAWWAQNCGGRLERRPTRRRNVTPGGRQNKKSHERKGARGEGREWVSEQVSKGMIGKNAPENSMPKEQRKWEIWVVHNNAGEGKEEQNPADDQNPTLSLVPKGTGPPSRLSSSSLPGWDIRCHPSPFVMDEWMSFVSSFIQNDECQFHPCPLCRFPGAARLRDCPPRPLLQTD